MAEASKYAELVGVADIRGTVYRDHVDFHTLYGELTLPRIMRKNCHCFPDSRIDITFPSSGKFDDHVKVKIIYFNGEKKILAKWGNLKIVTE